MKKLARKQKKQAIFIEATISAITLIILWPLWISRPGFTQEAWSAPQNLSNDRETSRYAAVVADDSGTLHVVWLSTEPAGAENNTSAFLYTRKSATNWSVPVDIFFNDSNIGLSAPQMAIDPENNLHLVWKEGDRIQYSRAHAPNAGSAANWRRPVKVSFQANSLVDPDIAVDSSGNLYIVFGVQSSQLGNIYYLISRDGGENWSSPEPVLNGLEKFEAINEIRLAVDNREGIHVAWTESNTLTGFPPVGVRYTHLLELGELWSRPVEIDGPFGLSGLITVDPDTVHWVWSGTVDQRHKFHRWSADRGRTWSPMIETLPIGGFQGWPALVLDSEERVHLIQAWGSGQAFLNHQIWNGSGWGISETILEGDANLPTNIVGSGASPNNPAAAIALGNELHVVTGQFEAHRAGIWTDDIFYLHKTLGVAGFVPEQILKPTESIATPMPYQDPVPLEKDNSAVPAEVSMPQFPDDDDTLGPLPTLLLGMLPASIFISLFVIIKLRHRR